MVGTESEHSVTSVLSGLTLNLDTVFSGHYSGERNPKSTQEIRDLSYPRERSPRRRQSSPPETGLSLGIKRQPQSLRIPAPRQQMYQIREVHPPSLRYLTRRAPLPHFQLRLSRAQADHVTTGPPAHRIGRIRGLKYHFLCYLVPYSRHEPYTGRSDYRTVPARGFELMDTANIRYGLRPYSYRKEYGRSRIRYG